MSWRLPKDYAGLCPAKYHSKPKNRRIVSALSARLGRLATRRAGTMDRMDAHRRTVIGALEEDAPDGDLTSRHVVPPASRCTAELRAQAAGVLAGRDVATTAFEVVAQQDGLGPVEVVWNMDDGDAVELGDVLAVVRGPARSILRAERVAINFLAHLSGVATLTRAFVEAAAPARLLCTRKTTPGLRALEREAVRAGGGTLHRASLSDAILIKDNHLRLAGGVREAVERASDAGVPVEVEAETLAEVEEALGAGAGRILLDNPTPELVRAALARVDDPDRLEISGGVTLESVGALVDAGARLVSVGRITHSAPALDVSLEVTDADV
jgi:nicotinate-nucleotide pyrophosphorylase (carboxylating)